MRMEIISESMMLEYKTVLFSCQASDKAKFWIPLFVTKVVMRMNLFVNCKRGGVKNQQAIKACRKGTAKKNCGLEVLGEEM